MIALYWDIGRQIDERQQSEGWGTGVVDRLSQDLRFEFGEKSGFSARNLRYMQVIYREYKDHAILEPLAAKLAWTKNTMILDRCADPLQRQFYLIATAKFGWTRRVLDHQIDGQAYEKYLLKSLIAVELKIGEFQPEHKGKMEFYLVALNEQMKLEGENDAIGIIVCKIKKRTVVEYALKSAMLPIGVATYGITPHLPAAYKGILPSEEAIAERLAGWVQK